jgi:hypothetical protein
LPRIALTWNFAVCSLMARRCAIAAVGQALADQLQDLDLTRRERVDQRLGGGPAAQRAFGEALVHDHEAEGGGLQGGDQASRRRCHG